MKIKEGFVMREVAGQALVVATGKASQSFNGMIKLNSTAKDIWNLISEGKSESEIISALCEKYDVTEQKATADTSSIIEKMRSAGVFEDE